MTGAETNPQRDVLAGWFIRRVINPIVRWLARALRALRRHRRTHSSPVTAGPAGGRGAEGFFRSVDYSDRTPYRRPPTTYLRLQWLGYVLTSWAIVPKNVVNLDVPGRRSGVIRRTTLLRVEHAGEYFLVALAGESEWVRNVRAAAGRVVVGRKTRHAATLIEVPLQERAPVIRSYLLRGAISRRAGWSRPQGVRRAGLARRASLGVRPPMPGLVVAHRSAPALSWFSSRSTPVPATWRRNGASRGRAWVAPAAPGSGSPDRPAARRRAGRVREWLAAAGPREQAHRRVSLGLCFLSPAS